MKVILKNGKVKNAVKLEFYNNSILIVNLDSGIEKTEWVSADKISWIDN